jgi:acetyl-CoA carboxylase biotin carboxylase subunit
MNTRLQVEHPITEWITGVDLVREMVLVAGGEKRKYNQADVSRRGAAIECRVYAEDPQSGFLPSPGTIEALRSPGGPWVRDDSGYYAGAEVPSHYDPQIAKLSVWGPTRDLAMRRMRRALAEYVVTGIRTNLAFHQKVLAHPEFLRGRYDTGFIERFRSELLGYAELRPEDEPIVAAAVALAVHREAREPRSLRGCITIEPVLSADPEVGKILRRGAWLVLRCRLTRRWRGRRRVVPKR